MVIDAHVHVWDLTARDQPWIPARSPLRRSFGLAELSEAVSGTSVERVVLVQVINDADETADLLSVADDPLVAGVVGWVDLLANRVDDVLTALSGTGRLVGVRHQALAEADPAGWLAAAPLDAALTRLERAELAFDLIVRPEQLSAATAVARAHPGLRLVLDHLGKPPIASGELEPWGGAIRRLAAEPNVMCKLSGLHTVAAADWTYADLAPFLDVALAAFGPYRLLFGSDWPVSSAAASYDDVYGVADRFCNQLSTAERAAVLGESAIETYRLDRRRRDQAVKPPSTE